MTGAEARGNAQPDFAALNPGLAGAPSLQQQQQADRIPAKIIQFVTLVPAGYSDSDVLMVKSAQDRQGEHTPYPLGVTLDRRVLV